MILYFIILEVTLEAIIGKSSRLTSVTVEGGKRHVY